MFVGMARGRKSTKIQQKLHKVLNFYSRKIPKLKVYSDACKPVYALHFINYVSIEVVI